jgi:hypothetical protein
MNLLPGWRERPFKVKVGLGSGLRGATLEIVLEGPEYMGPFLGAEEDARRMAWQHEWFTAFLANRFPNEKITIISLIPTAKRIRPTWDR